MVSANPKNLLLISQSLAHFETHSLAKVFRGDLPIYHSISDSLIFYDSPPCLPLLRFNRCLLLQPRPDTYAHALNSLAPPLFSLFYATFPRYRFIHRGALVAGFRFFAVSLTLTRALRFPQSLRSLFRPPMFFEAIKLYSVLLKIDSFCPCSPPFLPVDRELISINCKRNCQFTGSLIYHPSLLVCLDKILKFPTRKRK